MVPPICLFIPPLPARVEDKPAKANIPNRFVASHPGYPVPRFNRQFSQPMWRRGSASTGAACKAPTYSNDNLSTKLQGALDAVVLVPDSSLKVGENFVKLAEIARAVLTSTDSEMKNKLAGHLNVLGRFVSTLQFRFTQKSKRQQGLDATQILKKYYDAVMNTALTEVRNFVANNKVTSANNQTLNANNRRNIIAACTHLLLLRQRLFDDVLNLRWDHFIRGDSATAQINQSLQRNAPAIITDLKNTHNYNQSATELISQIDALLYTAASQLVQIVFAEYERFQQSANAFTTIMNQKADGKSLSPQQIAEATHHLKEGQEAYQALRDIDVIFSAAGMTSFNVLWGDYLLTPLAQYLESRQDLTQAKPNTQTAEQYLGITIDALNQGNDCGRNYYGPGEKELPVIRFERNMLDFMAQELAQADAGKYNQTIQNLTRFRSLVPGVFVHLSGSWLLASGNNQNTIVDSIMKSYDEFAKASPDKADLYLWALMVFVNDLNNRGLNINIDEAILEKLAQQVKDFRITFVGPRSISQTECEAASQGRKLVPTPAEVEDEAVIIRIIQLMQN